MAIERLEASSLEWLDKCKCIRTAFDDIIISSFSFFCHRRRNLAANAP